MQISPQIVTGVKAFLESGDRSFLNELKGLERTDITGQAIVRYLMQLKHWPFTPDSDFAQTLEYFFGHFPERTLLEPAEYQATTFSLIKDAFDYECVVVVPEVRERPAVVEKPARKTSRKPATVPDSHVEESEGESGSRSFKTLREMDTTGASERLKQVIAIQRSTS